MLERLARDKCSSLLGLFISNEHFFVKLPPLANVIKLFYLLMMLQLKKVSPWQAF